MTLPTYAEDPQLWDEIAKKPISGLLVRLGSDNRCPLCRYRERDGWFERRPRQPVPLKIMLSRFLAHLSSTHGMDADDVLDQLI